MSAPAVLRLVVMGVSGCGKSTLAAALGEALRLRVTDGDDLHLPESLRKMQAGTPLGDDDRWPWLDRVAACLMGPIDPAGDQLGRVVACSALKRVYRDCLRRQLPELRFVFLNGHAELLRKRMTQRTGHFMPLQLLDSQLNALERPGEDEDDVLTIEADQMLADQVAQVARAWASTATGTYTPDLP